MSKTPWYDSDNPDRVARAAGGRAMLITVIAVLFVAVLSAAGWAIKVATSDVRGQGDALVQKNSGTNRIAAQERFEELHQEIVAADRKIDIHAQALTADPDNRVLQTNLTGAQTYCTDVVAQYNAESRKYTAADFRAVDLPYQIDTADPASDCKPTQ